MSNRATIAAITAIALALVALQYWNSLRSEAPELPTLARNLPRDAHEANRVFKKRVRSRFPIGAPADTVERELAAEGFRIEAGDKDWRSAELKRKIYPCYVLWRVRWRADARERVAETDAQYGLDCKPAT